MLRAQLIPLGAGVIAALLHLSVTLGSPGAFMLAYFAQAPIAAVGLAFGFMPAAMAAAISSGSCWSNLRVAKRPSTSLRRCCELA